MAASVPPNQQCRRGLAELLERIDTWVSDLERLPFDAGRIRKLGRVIAYRRRLLSH